MKSVDAVTIVLLDGSKIRTPEVIFDFDIAAGRWCFLRFWNEEATKEDSIPAGRVKCIIPS